jgi:hypothetical protein
MKKIVQNISCFTKKIVIISLVLPFNILQPTFSQTNFIKSYPKIISINKDGQNDILLLKYNNDEGKNLVLKIYDIKGLIILEKKISNTVEENYEPDGSYSIAIDITNSYNDLFNTGTYIFLITSEEKVLVKGSFAVVK